MAAPIIILGANGGIGEALARRLSARGAELFLTGRSPEKVGALADELKARHAVCDVLDPGSVAAAVAEADTGEGIAGLAYCVGSIDIKPLKATKPEDFIQTYRLNVLGATDAIRAAEKGLKAAKGSVVLFSTVAVQQGFANHALIATAKGAVEGLGRSLAAEYAPHVRVNVVAPSLTRTPLAHTLTANEQMLQSIAGLHALGRIGEAEDIAALADFLLGPDSAWITGQVYGVDGGRSSLRTKG
ncbi:short-chain dehydrogenase [Skermanella stibiiresistens SB22]|uniref:Short-chain dehydrogenase n=1 Tax=Skermanella stibiiresistens SB22 TaxID=1385369 RepID=W9H226_9PROT|nr:SDR family oxidoreductase [Skermanella stibiiresistens]EWY38762.1 short-chain dehydrogenase [Skermanella stibiiresistens SB22]